MQTNQQSIIIETQATNSGHQIGILTLNEPKSLNAKTAEMCRQISNQLKKWQNDDEIVAVILKSNSDKAFCAGGDIRKLYQERLTNSDIINSYSEKFFTNEYGLDYQIYYYNKPIILWASGIVMGGGMGLMAMASHRIVTETTRFAMPEISIGLYPDATGSWLLQRFPAKSGLFFGLTGANGNAMDALLANMAEFATTSNNYQGVLNVLILADWHSEKSLQETASFALAKIHQTEHLAESNLFKHWLIIQKIVNQGSLVDIDKAFQSVKNHIKNDEWLQTAIRTYQNGCPVSACLTYEIFQRSASLSLEQILCMELNISLHCLHNADFSEGVRALLIDKDKSPKWSRTLAECMTEDGKNYIQSHFISPFAKNQHP
ncbi:MAG: enoyl-CoA hydratase/isomerase family protein [Moraxellaceae bacterium]|nr:enoyl-CoA hydratase/isomerase family protein [Moraxellaceae bacterium]